MFNKFDKRALAPLFQARLKETLAASQYNQSSLAQAIGVDRSTISQLLKSVEPRLPNAHVVAQCADKLNISTDYLLGLTDFHQPAADVIAQAMTMADAPRAVIDDQIFNWHKEAAGYKIRHVPAGLPDMLKTPDMLAWEYSPALGRSSQQAIGAATDRLNWMRGTQSDYEIAFPIHDLHCFTHGLGYYDGCPKDLRLNQLDWMLELYDQLYPKMRVHLFDARHLYSSPATVFGPLVAALYIGQKYLIFRDTQRVQALTQHFDELVKMAQIGSRDFPVLLQDLKQEIQNS